MKTFLGQFVIAVLILIICGSNQSSGMYSGGVGANLVEPSSGEDLEEPDQTFQTQLEHNYNTDFAQMLEFFKSVQSDLAKINARLDRLEKQEVSKSEGTLRQAIAAFEKRFEAALESNSNHTRNLKLELDRNSKTCRRSFFSHASDVSSLKEENGRLNNNIRFLRNPDNFLSSLPQPVKGESLNGSTFENITESLPKEWSLAIEIRNYLDQDLTDYQIHQHGGSEQAKGPATISAKTFEVATFKTTQYTPVAEMLYRIGGTNSSLYLFFNCGYDYRTIAVALLPNTTSLPSEFNDVCPILGPIRSYECFTEVPYDTTKSLLVNEGNIFTTLKFTYSNSTSILSVNVFELTL